MPPSLRLGINIDHLATLRQQRHTPYPDLIDFVRLAQDAGAEQITLHLREDRRHIQDADVWALRPVVREMNLEIAANPEMLDIAYKLRPDWVCLVPERRAELTTEGGLAATAMEHQLVRDINRLKEAGIRVSLFINADAAQVACAQRVGAAAVEFHTGGYADWWSAVMRQQGAAPKPAAIANALAPLVAAAAQAVDCGMYAHAGHGLTLANVGAVAAITNIRELNIGHALVCDALRIGWVAAINAMQHAMQHARADRKG